MVYREVHHVDLLKWYVIPNVGRFNNYELRFHCDWNWLMSATLEVLQKYEMVYTFTNSKFPENECERTYCLLRETPLPHVTMYNLWLKLSDYAIALVNQLEHDSNSKLKQ
jgi:hypothetical protein